MAISGNNSELPWELKECDLCVEIAEETGAPVDEKSTVSI